MRLFKVLVLTAALLDLAMFLQSPASPLYASTPTQTVGFSSDSADIAALNHR